MPAAKKVVMKKGQGKKATKAKQREQRKKQRAHKVDRDYIVEMLEANPSWVPKLASVIRQGGMKILMDIEKADCENTAPEVDVGKKWKGKNVRTLLAMPTHVISSMVMSTLPEDTDEPLRDDEWWQAAFCYQMHCFDASEHHHERLQRAAILEVAPGSLDRQRRP